MSFNYNDMLYVISGHYLRILGRLTFVTFRDHMWLICNRVWKTLFASQNTSD
jgi:hypothetical protein